MKYILKIDGKIEDKLFTFTEIVDIMRHKKELNYNLLEVLLTTGEVHYTDKRS